MPTYYDALNDFHRRNAINPLATAAQLMYLHLLHLNNCLGNGGSVKVSDRQLELSMCVTHPTIIKAKRQLKNAGLIDFESDAKSPRSGTRYMLLFFSKNQTPKIYQNDFGKNQTSKIDQSVYQSVDQSVDQTEAVSITRARQDQEQDTDKKSSFERRRAQVWDTAVEEHFAQKWLANRGSGVTAELLSYMKFIVDKHGTDFLDRLLTEAATALKSDRMSLRYLRGCYEFKLKGGNKRDKVSDGATPAYAKPDTRYDAEFGF